MLFIDLEELKIIKTYQFDTRGINMNLDVNATMSELSKAFYTAAAELLAQGKPAIECVYEFHIEDDGTVAEDDEAENFISIVNIAVSQFFKALTKEERRNRDYHLDVPENLKCVKMSFSSLKKAINNVVAVEKFNLKITYKDLVYILCDDKQIDIQPFVHEEDVWDA